MKISAVLLLLLSLLFSFQGANDKNLASFNAYAKFYFIKFCKQVARFLLVGLRGLEPPTSRLSGVRSNHLSYKPMLVLATVVVSSSSDALWWR